MLWRKKVDYRSLNNNILNGFREGVHFCCYQDLSFQGYSYTCYNGRLEEDNIQQCIDRAFVKEPLLLAFPHYNVIHGERDCFDHCPIINLEATSEALIGKHTSIFRFEEVRIKTLNCKML